MPSVNIQITPAGPIVNAFVAVTSAHAAALQKAGRPAPQPFPARLLVDTGASSTNLCASIIPPVGLMQTGVVPVHTPSTGSQPVNMPQYDARIIIPLIGGIHVLDPLPIICADFRAQGIHGLLGRDVLSKCAMHYNGSLSVCTLSF